MKNNIYIYLMCNVIPSDVLIYYFGWTVALRFSLKLSKPMLWNIYWNSIISTFLIFLKQQTTSTSYYFCNPTRLFVPLLLSWSSLVWSGLVRPMTFSQATGWTTDTQGNSFISICTTSNLLEGSWAVERTIGHLSWKPRGQLNVRKMLWWDLNPFHKCNSS